MHKQKPNLRSKELISLRTFNVLFTMILIFSAAILAGCAVVSSSQPNPTPGPVALQIATSSLPAVTEGASYAATLAATGGTTPYTWSITGGALPTGFGLSAATGTIAGTATMPGSFSFKAQVQDAKAVSTSASFSLIVAPAAAPTISGISPNSGPTAGGTAVTISGSNFRSGAGVQFGSLSARGVQIANSAQIQAVTPAESSGVVSITVKNSDGQTATAANAFTFAAPPLQIVTTSLPVGSVGASYSATLAASGGTPPYTWSATSGALPAGLQLSANAGTIAGTPTASGSFPFTAQVRDAKGASSSTGFSLSVSPNSAPTISSVLPNNGSIDGGTTVTISGSNFRSGAVVRFGSIAAASVQVVNSTQIQAVTPMEPGGVVNVSVQDSDGQVATGANAFTFTSPTSGTGPVVPTPSSDPAAPKIFNVSSSAQPGDIISIQGANIDSASQAWLAGAALSAATQLTVVNRVGQTWMAAQLPNSWTGALVLWISNSHGASRAVALNGAVPTHLDALQLVPGGAFRVIGRNLLAPGFNPSVTVDGMPATINLSASNENTLVVTAPTSLGPTSVSVIMVDNGNGTGAAQLDRKITVVSGSGDPLALGVGWGAGFKFAGNVIKVNTPCNGTQDDTSAIQAAISSASGSGGVVQLPAGTCRLTNTLTMKSNVVLQGAGKDITILKYGANYPIFAQNCDLVGIRDLSIVNSGAATQGPLWEQNTRSFIQRVKIDMGVSQQLFFTNNINLVVSQTDFIQRGTIGARGPYVFNSSSGLLFTGNTTTSIDGSPAFQATHDALFLNNRFTRDATNQNEVPVVVTHRFVMDFAYRIAVVGNTFDVINGPITNKNRNDGETLLAEGGGSARTENIGTVASGTSTTISDPSNTINVNPFGTGTPENYGVAIVSGTGAGQTREVVAYSNHTMTVDHPWEVVPDSTSHYATFVWGLEKSLLKGNTLVDNPRGIWLYQTAVRDVDILGNTITNGGGIFLRTFQSQAAKQFDPIYNVRIRDNKVNNSNGLWMSYTTVVFVNKDTTNFGIADIGIEVRNTNLTANTPNVTSRIEDYAGQEGFMNLLRSETAGGQLSSTPMLLGTIFQGGKCLNCNAAFIIGTGAYGTTFTNNQPLPSSPNFLTNWQTLGSGISGALNTVIQ